jgi:hypothetical protein
MSAGGETEEPDLSEGLLAPTALLGSWRFERTIDDRLAGRRTRVDGTATLSSDGAGRIRWSENGVMHGPGGDVPVSQTRLVAQDPAGAWQVLFSDGRPFHDWRPGAVVAHDCAPDDYRGLIARSPDGGWTMRWAASGPEKDYVIDTAYTRQ